VTVANYRGDLRGGFLGRFLFVTATEKAAAKGLTGGMDGIERMHLRDSLRALMKLDAGEAKFTPPARQLLEARISTWEDEVTGSHHLTDLTGFAVRLQTYALKLAMLTRRAPRSAPTARSTGSTSMPWPRRSRTAGCCGTTSSG
jgi:hypothetical protein